LVGGWPALPLDVEPILPGEGEIDAALRLAARMLTKYPKAFDIVTGDALYANVRLLNQISLFGLMGELAVSFWSCLDAMETIAEIRPP